MLFVQITKTNEESHLFAKYNRGMGICTQASRKTQGPMAIRNKKLVWKNADTWRTDRDTQSQTRKPNTRENNYKMHTSTHGLKTDTFKKS